MNQFLKVIAGLLLIGGPATAAVSVPTGFVAEEYVSGLNSPTAMAFAPDGRLFICEQGGQVRVVKDGQLLSTLYLSLTVNSSGERGLLGIALHPGFSNNRQMFVYYTATDGGIHNRVALVRGGTANPDIADPSVMPILDLPPLGATNHNGGALLFKRGKLFVAVGDNANGSNSQTLSNPLGKILRINTDGTIPTNNPFYTQTTGKNRAIWALGLRNPFTMAVQPGSERILINDVGQDTWEEINEGRPGANYGWPGSEGPTNQTGIDGPIYAYRQDDPQTPGCAVIGGAFYNPAVVRFPQRFVGKYFFADLCEGWLHVLNPSTGTYNNFGGGFSGPVGMAVNNRGNLFVLESWAGRVTRIRYAPPPAAAVGPSDQKS